MENKQTGLFYSPHSPRPNNPRASPERSAVLPVESLAQQFSRFHLGESSTSTSTSTGPTRTFNGVTPPIPRVQVQPSSLVQDPPMTTMNQGRGSPLWGSHGLDPSVVASLLRGFGIGLQGNHSTMQTHPNPSVPAGYNVVPHVNLGCDESFHSSKKVTNRHNTVLRTRTQEGSNLRESSGSSRHAHAQRDSTTSTLGGRALFLRVLSDGDPIETMKDKHGNYLFQQFMDDCDERDKALAVCNITQDGKRLAEAAKDDYGWKSVQKLITAAKTSSPLLGLVTSALSEGMHDLMTHSRGPELWMYCFRHLRPADNSFIFEAALKDFNGLAMDKKGSIFLQQCILHSGYPFRQLLLDQVIQNCFQLALDIYGNYVVQFVVNDLNEPEATQKICMVIVEHFEVLSQNKFGSYVVQKCLRSTAGGLLLQALFNCNIQTLEQLTKDPHGNYVVKTAMKVQKDSAIHGELVRKITGLPNDLKCHPNARNVLKPI